MKIKNNGKTALLSQQFVATTSSNPEILTYKITLLINARLVERLKIKIKALME